MDEQNFPHQMRAIGTRAIEEADRRGSAAIEAEHLLLAFAADPSSAAAKALAEVGLDHSAIDAALDEERARSLAFVGVTAASLPTPTARRRLGRPAWGASVKDVMNIMRRAPNRDRKGRSLDVEMLVAILTADLGTVPRALTIAGIERGDVIEVLHRS